MLFFGLGIMIGHCLESWLLSCFGGFGLLVLGLCILRRK